MPARVVDASALAAIVFNEPDGEALARDLEVASLIAPALLPFEMASICSKKLRAHPAARAAILEQYALVERMGVVLHPVDHTAVVLLSEQTGLTTYDAYYLSLAESTGSVLVTLDDRLGRAASSLLGATRVRPHS